MSGLFNDVSTSIIQLGSLLPESILLGSSLLYFMTLNKSFGVFAVFIIEVILSHKFVAWMFKETTGKSGLPKDKPDLKCFAGYKSIRADIERAVPLHQYPSYSFFSITAIATYLGLSTNEYSSTMTSMGPQWEGRAFMAYLFIFIMLIIFFLARLAFCDKPTELLIAFVSAIIIGCIFFKINVALFGTEGVNFLGLPYMTSKTKNGDDIYVCAQTSQ